MSIDYGDTREVDDVFDFVAALEYVDWLRHPSEHGADGFCITETLEQLVPNVARLKVGEDEDVGGFIELTEIVGSLEEVSDDGGVGLHLSIH